VKILVVWRLKARVLWFSWYNEAHRVVRGQRWCNGSSIVAPVTFLQICTRRAQLWLRNHVSRKEFTWNNQSLDCILYLSKLFPKQDSFLYSILERRQRPWPILILRRFPGISTERLRLNVDHDSWCSARDSNSLHSKCKTAVFPFQLWFKRSFTRVSTDMPWWRNAHV
jgi:hypothetical protein